MLTITLDTIRKQRNANEWRHVNRASCGEYEQTGDGNNIVNLCRDLIDAGHPVDTPVDVVRGSTKCFETSTLGRWINPPKKQQPAHLKRKW